MPPALIALLVITVSVVAGALVTLPGILAFPASTSSSRAERLGQAFAHRAVPGRVITVLYRLGRLAGRRRPDTTTLIDLAVVEREGPPGVVAALASRMSARTVTDWKWSDAEVLGLVLRRGGWPADVEDRLVTLFVQVGEQWAGTRPLDAARRGRAGLQVQLNAGTIAMVADVNAAAADPTSPMPDAMRSRLLLAAIAS